ncbi:NAD(P)/FAD-dependent oxidoreductase [Novosphingobium sp. RL4]|uniref:NAD(P)/FAD-dependent oxidoreductase n=1 Tax=Novosphingobium sp. RL4 TaxID=3109595 RepID=UPI002D781D6D|nr:FAD-dependent oxidoreductase [Novosphingobium sp. RL4]WRT94423.1 FAD-dependent oxidoreductase [Novosphingobium sp. RL4]
MQAVIVGAGQAGARAAKAMRGAGFEGSIKVFGSEAHMPYERPLLSKTLLQDPATPVPFVFADGIYQEAGIEVHTGATVTGIDRERQVVTLADGSTESYDRLLLATGSRVRTLAIDGYPPERILYLRSLDDCRAIEALIGGQPSVAIVGGGFIGLEVAATLAGHGCQVSVVEMADRLLPRLGCADASAMVLAHHLSVGVDVRLSAAIAGGEPGLLTLGDGDHIPADFIVAGVGVMPDTALAQAAGLAVTDGIVVDEFGQTSDPNIFAAGDVTRHFNPLLGSQLRLESWQNANLQAEAAGRTMAGVPTAYAEIPWLWSDQGGLNLQMAGAPQNVDNVVLRGDPAGEDGVTVFQFCEGRLVGGVTLNRGKEMPLIRRLLVTGDLALPATSLGDTAIPLRQFIPKKVEA